MPAAQHPCKQFLQISIADIITSVYTHLPQTGLPNATVVDDRGIIVHVQERLHLVANMRKVPWNINPSEDHCASYSNNLYES